MKILAVCGMGLGTGLVLRMTAEKAVRQLGVDADVEVADIGTARGALSGADLVITSAELAEQLGSASVPVVVVKNFVDVDGMAEQLRQALDG